MAQGDQNSPAKGFQSRDICWLMFSAVLNRLFE